MSDHALFLRVNDLARSTGWLHAPVKAYAVYGVVLFAVLLGLGLEHARRTGRPLLLARAVLAPAAVLLAVALNQPLGRAVHEARPYDSLPGILVLLPRSADFSFPSDHAVMAGAVAAGLLLVWGRLGLVAVVAALLLAFARVYVGVHFPVDVAAGLLFGAVVALCAVRMLEAPVARLVPVRLLTRAA